LDLILSWWQLEKQLSNFCSFLMPSMEEMVLYFEYIFMQWTSLITIWVRFSPFPTCYKKIFAILQRVIQFLLAIKLAARYDINEQLF
jgi:hypothetical protein